jgi:hypothetical protein
MAWAYVALMAGISLQKAEEQLALWLEASVQVAQKQSWSHQGVTYTRADADAIRANIEFWDRQCKRLARGGPRVRGVIAL